jgi:hypothetical protein
MASTTLAPDLSWRNRLEGVARWLNDIESELVLYPMRSPEFETVFFEGTRPILWLELPSSDRIRSSLMRFVPAEKEWSVFKFDHELVRAVWHSWYPRCPVLWERGWQTDRLVECRSFYKYHGTAVRSTNGVSGTGESVYRMNCQSLDTLKFLTSLLYFLMFIKFRTFGTLFVRPDTFVNVIDKEINIGNRRWKPSPSAIGVESGFKRTEDLGGGGEGGEGDKAAQQGFEQGQLSIRGSLPCFDSSYFGVKLVANNPCVRNSLSGTVRICPYPQRKNRLLTQTTIWSWKHYYLDKFFKSFPVSRNSCCGHILPFPEDRLLQSSQTPRQCDRTFWPEDREFWGDCLYRRRSGSFSN